MNFRKKINETRAVRRWCGAFDRSKKGAEIEMEAVEAARVAEDGALIEGMIL